jgi:hypothetical protein
VSDADEPIPEAAGSGDTDAAAAAADPQAAGPESGAALAGATPIEATGRGVLPGPVTVTGSAPVASPPLAGTADGSAPTSAAGAPPPFAMAAFSAAARTGLDLSSLASWDPTLARPSRCEIPIDVQALVASAGSPVTAVPVLPQLANPQDPAAGPVPDITQAMPPVPPFSPATTRAPGVYLHWAMPDGLTGTSSPLAPAAADGTAALAGSMPPLADRWLIVRVGGGIPRRTRGWIVESERGRLADLATWAPTSSPPAADPGATPNLSSAQLTAIAGGDPAWAAAFDAVQNRFAMYDDLSDLDPADAAGPLAYLVCGWWSDPANDPLSAPDLTAYADRITSLKWSIPPIPAGAAAARDLTAQRAAGLGYDQPALHIGSAVSSAGLTSAMPSAPVHPELAAAATTWLAGQAEEYPQLSLLHGCVLGVLPQGGGTDPMPAADQIEVGIGATATEAFAAIIAAVTASAGTQLATAEQLIEAFSQGLISQLDTPDGLVDLDQATHDGGFSSQPAPSTRTDRVLDGDILAQGAAAVAGSLSASQQQSAAAAAAASQGAAGEIAADRSAGFLRIRSVHETLDALALKQQAGDPGSPPPAAGMSVRDIAVAGETWKLPVAPVVTVRGAVRSLRHGYDGRLTADGTLACRVSGQEFTAFEGLVNGSDIVAPLGNGALPPECDSLLQELVLDDPNGTTDIAAAAAAAADLPEAAVLGRLQAEQVLRWDVSLPAAGKDLLRSLSLRSGTDASLIATTSWAQPWIPLYLEWELALRVNGELGSWGLGDVDLDPATQPDPGSGQSILTYSGRSLLTSVAARTFGAQVQAFINDEDARSQSAPVVQPSQLASLSSLAGIASQVDVLSGALSELRPQLLGLSWADAARTYADPSGNVTPVTSAAPPLLLSGGIAWFTGLRLVDAFGRTVDLSSNPVTISSQLTPPSTPPPSAAPPSTPPPPGTPPPSPAPAPTPPASPAAAPPPGPGPFPIMLRPRLTLPARMMLDFVDAAAADGATPALAMVDQSDPASQISPLSGWLLPDHLDGALEVYDESANPLGMLLEDVNGRVIWEGAPGLPGPLGAPPAPAVPGDLACRHVVRLAVGLVAADVAAWDATPSPAESALAALLRTIDTTAWTSDPLGAAGTEHRSALVGRPIAVLRMTVGLDVDDDPGDSGLTLDAPSQAALQTAIDRLTSQPFTVRFGELTRTDDSVLGYFVDDDYGQFTPVSPEVLGAARASGRLQGQLGILGGTGPGTPPPQAAIAHQYVDDGETPLSLRPGQVVTLTVLMAPGGAAHATSGIVPRVSRALARDWIAASLKILSPTFRVGPALTDPAAVRLPKATGLPAQQVLTRRSDPTTWQDDPIAVVTTDALLPDAPAVTLEGWLRAAAAPASGSGPEGE